MLKSERGIATIALIIIGAVVTIGGGSFAATRIPIVRDQIPEQIVQVLDTVTFNKGATNEEIEYMKDWYKERAERVKNLPLYEQEIINNQKAVDIYNKLTAEQITELEPCKKELDDIISERSELMLIDEKRVTELNIQMTEAIQNNDMVTYEQLKKEFDELIEKQTNIIIHQINE